MRPTHQAPLALAILSALILPATLNAKGPISKIWGAAKNDQERCQAEADHMAKNRKFCHVGPCIGRFEGIGWGSSPKCGTCTPRGKMRLTGDACAKCSDGRWVRVRSWR